MSFYVFLSLSRIYVWWNSIDDTDKTVYTDVCRGTHTRVYALKSVHRDVVPSKGQNHGNKKDTTNRNKEGGK